jgi:tetratricopeptide (TPR) repeat protein
MKPLHALCAVPSLLRCLGFDGRLRLFRDLRSFRYLCYSCFLCDRRLRVASPFDKGELKGVCVNPFPRLTQCAKEYANPSPTIGLSKTVRLLSILCLSLSVFRIDAIAETSDPKPSYDRRLSSYPNAQWLYKEATEKNNTNAAFDLALFYQNNIKDYRKAIEWFERVYKENDTEAAYSIGVVYDDYLKDYPKAIEWYKIASDRGFGGSSYALATLYEDRLKDYPNAIKWYEIAHKQKFGGAAYALGLLYKKKIEDYPNAIKWYEIAYKQNDKEAAYALGVLYEDQLKDIQTLSNGTRSPINRTISKPLTL